MKISRRDLIKAFALGAAGLMLPKGVIADEPIKKYWQLDKTMLSPQPYQEPEFPLNKYGYGSHPTNRGELPFGIRDHKIIGIAINERHIMYHREINADRNMPPAVMQSGLITSPWIENVNAFIEGPIHAGDFVALGSDGKLRKADPNTILSGLGG